MLIVPSKYHETILRELRLTRIYYGGHYLNNLRNADDTALMADSKGKLKELLNNVVEESRNKELLMLRRQNEWLLTKKTV